MKNITKYACTKFHVKVSRGVGGGGVCYMGLSYNAHVALGFIKFMRQSQPTPDENPNERNTNTLGIGWSGVM